MLTQFRYRQFLVTINSETGELKAVKHISISEAKRRNRKLRWPTVETFKFPSDAQIFPDNARTNRQTGETY